MRLTSHGLARVALVFLLVTQSWQAWGAPKRAVCRLLASEFLTSSEGFGTDSLLVIQGGKTVFEWSDGTYRPQSPHALWSISKTLTTLVAGRLAKRGLIELDDPVQKYVPYSKRRALLSAPSSIDEYRYSQLTLRNLINLSSGLDWQELATGGFNQLSAINMLYGEHHRDAASYVLSRPFKAHPGKIWNYSTGDFTLLSYVLEQATHSSLKQLASELFNQIGISKFVIEKDRQGTSLGGSHFFLTPKDLSKVGRLLMNGGEWNGVNLIAKEWIDFMREVSPGQLGGGLSGPFIEESGVYGGGLWLNASIGNLNPIMPHAPRDIFFAAGSLGQYLMIVPSEQLIVVRTGHDSLYWKSLDVFANRILGCFGNQPVSLVGPASDPAIQLSPSFKDVAYIIQSGIVASMIAKEFCSWHILSGLTFEECQQRANLPDSLMNLFELELFPTGRLEVRPSLAGSSSIFGKSPPATASIDLKNRWQGCVLH